MTIFNDFIFRAKHALPGRSDAAAHPHWHRYYVDLWFSGEHDQDDLTQWIEERFRSLHGGDLTQLMLDSSDEGLAQWFLDVVKSYKETSDCFRVVVRNEARRGSLAGAPFTRENPDPYYGVGGRDAWAESLDEFAKSRRTS